MSENQKLFGLNLQNDRDIYLTSTLKNFETTRSNVIKNYNCNFSLSWNV